jgi:hypothetical protein
MARTRPATDLKIAISADFIDRHRRLPTLLPGLGVRLYRVRYTYVTHVSREQRMSQPAGRRGQGQVRRDLLVRLLSKLHLRQTETETSK